MAIVERLSTLTDDLAISKGNAGRLAKGTAKERVAAGGGTP